MYMVQNSEVSFHLSPWPSSSCLPSCNNSITLGCPSKYVHYKYVYIYVCVCVCEYVCDIFFSFEHKGQQPELTALHLGKPGSPSLISDPRDNVFSACSSKTYLYFLHPL